MSEEEMQECPLKECAVPVKHAHGGDVWYAPKTAADSGVQVGKPITEPRYGDSASREFLQHLFTYHRPMGDQVRRYEVIRNAGFELASVVDSFAPISHERDKALDAIREAVMWANAAIACNEVWQEDEHPLTDGLNAEQVKQIIQTFEEEHPHHPGGHA